MRFEDAAAGESKGSNTKVGKSVGIYNLGLCFVSSYPSNSSIPDYSALNCDSSSSELP